MSDTKNTSQIELAVRAFHSACQDAESDHEKLKMLTRVAGLVYGAIEAWRDQTRGDDPCQAPTCSDGICFHALSVCRTRSNLDFNNALRLARKLDAEK